MNELDVVLAEYKSLREEIIRKFQIHLQLYSIYTSALLLFYGLVFVNKVYYLIIVTPFFSLAFIFRIVWEQSLIKRLGSYIHDEIESEKIPKLVGTLNAEQQSSNFGYNDLWMGWEHYLREKFPKRYSKYSIFMLFVGFSAIPAVIYNLYIVLAFSLGIDVVSKLSFGVYLLCLILNYIIGSYMVLKIVQL